MIFGSVCSGIEAATVAWAPLGWRAAFVSDIDPFARAVLAHRCAGVPLRGDFTDIQAGDHESVSLLVGGTPCQSFSSAGLRGGLDDNRGNLALEFLRLVDRLRPRWVVWENVPGVFSSTSHESPDPRPPDINLDGDDGPVDGTEVVVEDEYDADERHAFASFLAGLSELGYGWAYRVLDAQYVRVDGLERAVPQRRRRVFVVGYSGDWRPPAAVLFEPDGLRGDPSPRRTTGQEVAGTLTASAGRCGGDVDDGRDGRLIPEVSNALAARNAKQPRAEDNVGIIPAHPPAIAFNARQDPHAWEERCGALDAMSPQGQAVATGWVVRRLTPRECERLMGFPYDWTLVPYRGRPAVDTPRYRALGNSIAINCLRWIGQRIETFEASTNAASHND